MSVKKAVFPVAGFGTRFLPATKATPKEMLPIVDKPIVKYAVEEDYEAGIREFIFITHHAKRAIEDHFDQNKELHEKLINDKKLELAKSIEKIGGTETKFTYIRQDEPKGLGHAIGCAQHIIQKGEHFAVILADDLMMVEGENVMQQMISVNEKYNKQVIGLEKIDGEDISKFGVVAVEKSEEKVNFLSDIVEKPNYNEAPSNLAVVGRYIFKDSIFKFIDNENPGKNNEIQITDAIQKDIENFVGYEFDGKRFDCGSKIGYLKANLEFGLKDNTLKDEFTEYLKGKKNL